MNNTETMDFIEKCNKLGSKPGLASIIELTKRLGNPQDSLKFIHIAGTNGKGSVLAFVSTALTMAGYKVGRYISPVFFEYRERFQINGKMIGRQKLNEYMDIVKNACDDMVKDGFIHPTSFEIETALAFLYFKDQQCDIVVLETGMGGLLDATNLITTTLISVITSISMDHMQYLGDSIEKITEHKAGIIKSGAEVVTCNTNKDVLKVIQNTCKEKNADLTTVSLDEISHIRYGLARQSFIYRNMKYEIGLAGSYQIENALLALRVLKLIQEKSLNFNSGKKPHLTDEKIQKALSATKWEGRFSVINKNPLFLVDGAHNEGASLEFAHSVDFYFTNKRKIYIMGMFRDKECEKVIHNTVTAADCVITVATPHNDRALSAYELAMLVKKYNANVTVADSLEEAVEMSYLFANKDTVIIAFGSLAYLGELMRIVENHKLVRSDTHDK